MYIYKIINKDIYIYNYQLTFMTNFFNKYNYKTSQKLKYVMK